MVALLVCDLQARLWVQLMRELRNGVKLKKVQQKQFDPLPTEYQLTPFEMLMQDIRARNYKLRKVMVRGTGTVPSLCAAQHSLGPSCSHGSGFRAQQEVPLKMGG